MPSISPEQQNIQDRVSDKRRRLSLYAAGLIGVAWLPLQAFSATVVVSKAYESREDIVTLAQKPTGVEQRLSQTLLDPVAQHKTRLKCTDKLPRKMEAGTPRQWHMIGYVNLDLERIAKPLPTVVNMSTDSCLKALTYLDTIADGQNAKPGRDIYDFTHEAAHIRIDSKNEALTTCATLQLMPEVASNLGLDDTASQQLESATLKTYYSKMNGLPEQYKSKECSQGGEYDLGLSNSAIAFPYGR